MKFSNLKARKKPGQRGYKPRFNAKPAGQPHADMFSYDNALPCKNPKCKSHGKPHPNCKCYGSKNSLPQSRLTGLAHGGTVGHFCENDQSHQSDCEYFMDGGISGLEEVPDSKIPKEDPDTQGLQEVPPEKLGQPEDVSGLQEVPSEKLSTDYTTPSQQVATVLEGGAQGALGPIATWAETHLGVDPKDIAGRQAFNPGLHGTSEAISTAASLLTGFGEVGLIGKAAEAAADAAKLGKIGSGIIRGFLTNGLIQGNDEISKGLLGQGDPTHPVAAALVHMGAAGLLGAGVGGLGGAASKGLESLEAQKIGTKASSLVQGMGSATSDLNGTPMSSMEYPQMRDMASFDKGVKIVKEEIPKYLEKAGQTLGIGAAIKYQPNAGGLLIGQQLGKWLGKSLTGPVNKYITPAAVRVLSGDGAQNIYEAIDYAGKVGSGANKINNAMTSLFTPSAQQAYDSVISEPKREKLRNYVETGEQNKQIQSAPQDPGYAEGGPVERKDPSPSILHGTSTLAQHFPEQNILLQAAKGRVNNYLNSVRPLPTTGKMPFDTEPPNKHKERDYNKVLDLANDPLRILNHVKDGTLTIEQMKHFSGMYPELHDHLSQRMTENISQKQLDGEMVPYKTRQAMSMFLGSPLDSTMTPMSIQSIQATFSGGQSQQPQGPKPGGSKKGSPGKLDKLATNLQTSDQAKDVRANKD